MKFDKIRDYLKDIPHTPPEDGEILYNFVLKNQCGNILELGFQHGVSTLYMAAALDELNFGKITTIDNKTALEVKPTIFELTKLTGLETYINPIFANNSYTWELMKILNNNALNQTKNKFDFCFIDGAHNWETDGFAFFLVDKLLLSGSYILFDDLFWSYSQSQGLKHTDFVKLMADDEKNTPQIELVFKLLVAEHPNYTDLKIDGRWGWAKKINSDIDFDSNKLDEIYNQTSITRDFQNIARKIKSRIKNL